MVELNARPFQIGVVFQREVAPLILIAVIGFVAMSAVAVAETAAPGADAAGAELPEKKRTTLGLYVTAAEAYAKWQAAPDSVMLIDVRTPEEYGFIGHPEMAWNVPFAFVTYERKDGKTSYGPRSNPNFVEEIRTLAGPTDTLLLMCRSGDRSARAADELAAAGFTTVYTVTDGMEGDKVDDPGSVFHGKRMRNGWKNTGLPWVYSIDPDRVILEEGTSR
jgi:rhodanese-related sulfurtransferase